MAASALAHPSHPPPHTASFSSASSDLSSHSSPALTDGGGEGVGAAASASSMAPLRYSISFLLSLATSPLSAEKPTDLHGDCVRLDAPVPVSHLVAAATAVWSSSSSSSASAGGSSDGAVNGGGGRGHRWSIRELDGQKGAAVAAGGQQKEDERSSGWRGAGATTSSRRWDGAERERSAGVGGSGSRYGGPSSSTSSSSRYRGDERYGQDAATPAWFDGDAAAVASSHDGHWEASSSHRDDADREDKRLERETREEATSVAPSAASASHDVEASRDLMAKLGVTSAVEVAAPSRRAAPPSPPSQAVPTFADTRPSWALQAERELAAHRAQWLTQQKEREELQQRRLERERVEEAEAKEEQRSLQPGHGRGAGRTVEEDGEAVELARRAALLLQAAEVESEFDRFDELLSRKARQTEDEPAEAEPTAARRTQPQAKVEAQPQAAAAAWNGGEQEQELIIPQHVPRVVDPFMGDNVFGAFGGKSLALRFPADSAADGGLGRGGRREVDAWGVPVGSDARSAQHHQAYEQSQQGGRVQSTSSAASSPSHAEHSPWGTGGLSAASLWSNPTPPPSSSSFGSSPTLANAGWPTASSAPNGDHSRFSSSSPASSSRPPFVDPRQSAALQQQPFANQQVSSAAYQTHEGGHKIHPNDLFRMAAQAQAPAASSGWPTFPSPPPQAMGGSSPHRPSSSSAAASSASAYPLYGSSASMPSPHINGFSAGHASQLTKMRHAAEHPSSAAAAPPPYSAYSPAQSAQPTRGPPSSSPQFTFTGAPPSASPSSSAPADGDGDPLSALVSRSRARKVGALAASTAYPPSFAAPAAAPSPSTPHGHGLSSNPNHSQTGAHSAYAYPTAPSYPYKAAPQSFTSATPAPALAYPSMYTAAAGSGLASSPYTAPSLSSASPSSSTSRSQSSPRGDSGAAYSPHIAGSSATQQPFPSSVQHIQRSPHSTAAYYTPSLQPQQQQQQHFAAYQPAQGQAAAAAQSGYPQPGARPQPSSAYSDYTAAYAGAGSDPYVYGVAGSMPSPFPHGAVAEQSSRPPHLLAAQPQQQQQQQQQQQRRAQ